MANCGYCLMERVLIVPLIDTKLGGGTGVCPVCNPAVVRIAYRRAAGGSVGQRLVYPPDKLALSRARAALKRNLKDPGNYRDKGLVLLGLAIAEAHVGRRAGWIPEVQRIGVAIADLIADPGMKVSQW